MWARHSLHVSTRAAAIKMSLNFSVEGMIRGYHVYQDIWDAQQGERLTCIPEVGNIHDPFVISVIKDNTVIGHLPKKISAGCSLFLRRSGRIWCEVIGRRRYSHDLIQGGLEVPCMIHFEGQHKDILKLEKIVKFALSFSCESPPQESLTEKKDEVNVISITDHDPEPESKKVCRPQIWVQYGTSLSLSHAEKDIIINKKELNDLHIDFAQKLLSSQFPLISGFQSTLLQYK